MIIEQTWSFNSSKPTESVPCRKCGGLAERIISQSNLKIKDYKEFAKKEFQGISDNKNKKIFI